jgi:hypothetical protein
MVTALSMQQETPMKAAWRRRKDKKKKWKTQAEKKKFNACSWSAKPTERKETTILFLEFDGPLRRRQVLL